MKYLIVIVVVGAVLWSMFGRERRVSAPPPRPAPPRLPVNMVACAHCGVHLPQTEALFDVAGRPYCSEGHRVGGPR